MREGPRVGVFGLGNVLRRDDGFGPTVVRMLEAAYDLPPEAVFEDLGTPGLDLASWFVGLEAVVIVDAVEAPEPPGTLRLFRRADLPPAAGGHPRITNHEADLRDALAVADLHGDAPREVLLVGAVAADLGQGPGLSSALERALAPALTAVLDELGRLGIPVPPRDRPQPPRAWWRERGAGPASERVP